MRKIVFALLLAWGLAAAQAWDFEVGREFALTDEGTKPAWYVLARYNLPLTSEVLGARLWLLPEGGLWFPEGEPYHGYARLQVLLDQSFGTLFVDGRAGIPPGPEGLTGDSAYPDRSQIYALVRVGIRFGWPP